MAKINFYAVGHITNDLLPYPHVSGGVTNSAIAVQCLGCQSHIITKCPNNHPYIQEIEKTGVKVFNLPVKDKKHRNQITSFANYFDEKGLRKQYVSQVQESITIADLQNFPEIQEDSIILAAPVINEVDTKIFDYLSKFGLFAVAAQGFFRKILPDNRIIFNKWNKLESLKLAEFCFLSDEDLGLHNNPNTDLIFEILKFTKVFLLTRNKYGSIIYNKGIATRIQALKLNKDELFDLTGAGDVYAGVFLTIYFRTRNLHLSASFASFYASLKILEKSIKGVGINTIPTFEYINSFTPVNRNRYENFLKSNKVIDFTSVIDT